MDQRGGNGTLPTPLVLLAGVMALLPLAAVVRRPTSAPRLVVDRDHRGSVGGRRDPGRGLAQAVPADLRRVDAAVGVELAGQPTVRAARVVALAAGGGRVRVVAEQ